MELFERIGVIAEIARRKEGRPGRLGKTAVMKLLYLLQEANNVPMGYRFSLYTYGPYQSEVMSDIDVAESIGAISVTYEDERGYHIAQGASTERFGCPTVAEAGLNSIFERFGDMTARELELRSTLLFLSSGVPRSSLAEAARQLKPKYSTSEIENAIDELHRLNILPSALTVS